MDLELDRWLAGRPCDCGTCRAVRTEEIVVDRAIERPILRRARGRPLALFGDARTLDACGRDLAARLRTAGAEVRIHELAPHGAGLHADDVAVEDARSRLAGPGDDAFPVAVGAGTVNDVVKAAAHESGRRYVAVATAPSMNGYTSAIAALTVDGLKSTVPSTPPVAVVADPDVLAASPVRLAVSGLADLLSKPVSGADWKLGHVLWDEPYCPVPADLAGRAVEAAAAVAPGIRDGDAAARETLFRALLLSGLSMAIAGHSSPASGGEHLVSHYLDMTAAHAPGGPREPALHGEQVGVGTALSTRLWTAWFELAGRGLPAGAPAPDLDRALERIHALTRLPDALRRRFETPTRSKLARLGPPEARRRRIEERLPAVLDALRIDVEAARRLAAVLPAIGGPATPSSIGASEAELREAYREARWIRDRYTVLDLVDDTGLADRLEPAALAFEAPG